MELYSCVGLFLPVPDISALNCTSVTERSTLAVTCIPPSGSVVAELLCSVDGEDLRSCIAADTTSRKRGEDKNGETNKIKHQLRISITKLTRDCFTFIHRC